MHRHLITKANELLMRLFTIINARTEEDYQQNPLYKSRRTNDSSNHNLVTGDDHREKQQVDDGVCHIFDSSIFLNYDLW